MNIFKCVKALIGIKEEEKKVQKVVQKKVQIDDFNLFTQFEKDGLKKINTYPNITELNTLHINKTTNEEITLHFPNCKKVDNISIHQQQYDSAKINIILSDDCEIDYIGMSNRSISVTCGNIRRIWSGQQGCDLEINKAKYIEQIDVEYFGKVNLNDTIKIGYINCGAGRLTAENVKEVVSVRVNPFGWVNLPNCERIIRGLKCRDGEITVKKDCKFEGKYYVYGLGGVKKV